MVRRKRLDKIPYLKSLRDELMRTDVKDILERPEMRTADYWDEKLLSDKIQNNFLRPFYSSIFLENKLTTSSRMFEFMVM